MSRYFTWFPIGGFRRTQFIASIGLFYKNVGILLGGVSDCEELVGVDQGAKYETLWQALMHKCIKNNRYAPRGDFSPAKSLKQHFNIRKNQDS